MTPPTKAMLELADEFSIIREFLDDVDHAEMPNDDTWDVTPAARALDSIETALRSSQNGEPSATALEQAKALFEEAWRQTCLGPGEFDDYAVPLMAKAISQNGERERVIEECAKVAERYIVGPPEVTTGTMARAIADMIRALKSGEKGS